MWGTDKSDAKDEKGVGSKNYGKFISSIFRWFLFAGFVFLFELKQWSRLRVPDLGHCPYSHCCILGRVAFLPDSSVLRFL